MIDQVSNSPGITDDAPQAAGCGALLRQARERSGLALGEISQRLKMQVRTLQALEEERWEQLGAPVFVRGQLRSYAKLLKVDIEPYLQQFQFQPVRPAELVSHTHIPRYRRVLESAARRSVYVIITLCFFAIPVWLATQSHLGGQPQRTASLDVVPEPVAPATGNIAGEVAPQTQAVAAPRPVSPITASLTPLPRSDDNGGARLTLHMSGDSWVQVDAPDGSTVEQGLFKAGEDRSYRAGEIGRVVLGNAAAVEVQQAGSTVDTTPYRRANVARFTVSSDGSLAPVAE